MTLRPGECAGCGFPFYGRTGHAEFCAAVLAEAALYAKRYDVCDEACTRPHYARGMCERHYRRWLYASRRGLAA